MKMEGGLVEHRREIVGHVNGKVIRKKKVKRRIPSSSSSPSPSSSSEDSAIKRENLPVCLALQKLYSCCKNVFKGAGIVPPPQDVQSLCTILDNMRPEDVGLSRDLQFFKHGRHLKKNSRVTFTTVYECQNFALVLFFLPASAVIPLHNHPEMTVFNKLLLGTMHIKAYDWADSSDVEHCKQHPLRLAKLKANSVFTAPCNSSVLYPTSGGNLHEFTAVTSCAVLDVLGPPYSKDDGRDCTYYRDFRFKSSDGKLVELKDDENSYGLLQEIEVPEQAKMDCIEYRGPRVIEIAP